MHVTDLEVRKKVRSFLLPVHATVRSSSAPDLVLMCSVWLGQPASNHWVLRSAKAMIVRARPRRRNSSGTRLETDQVLALPVACSGYPPLQWRIKDANMAWALPVVLLGKST